MLKEMHFFKSLLFPLLFFKCSFLNGFSPDLFSIASGCFDVCRSRYRCFEFELEYKFYRPLNHFVDLRPLVGLMANSQGSYYAYLGVNFDLLFFEHIHFAPGFAAGYYHGGGGKNLGYPLEFRSGIELGWQFSDSHRLGIHFYHLSNASISKRNPGEESLVLFYDIPIIKGFPFIRDNK